MKLRYNNFFKIILLYNPTQISIVFRVLYSESKTDKYIPSKLQSTLSSLTTTIYDFASRQGQHLAGAFLKRLLTIIEKWQLHEIENLKLYLIHFANFF